MSEAKTFASLSPTLLARKGAAKPAMRPQLQPLGHYPAPELTPADHDEPHDVRNDDLGWNDMGEPHGAPETATVLPFVAGEANFGAGSETGPLTTGIPEVVRSQDALAGRLEAGRLGAPPADPIPLAAHRLSRDAKSIDRRSALADGRRAAFTLRVDSDRHLKLRLACTVQGRSAQQLVTEALDRLFDGLPELDDLARRVKRR
jgi:hypothetical protein